MTGSVESSPWLVQIRRLPQEHSAVPQPIWSRRQGNVYHHPLWPRDHHLSLSCLVLSKFYVLPPRPAWGSTAATPLPDPHVLELINDWVWCCYVWFPAAPVWRLQSALLLPTSTTLLQHPASSLKTGGKASCTLPFPCKLVRQNILIDVNKIAIMIIVVFFFFHVISNSYELFITLKYCSSSLCNNNNNKKLWWWIYIEILQKTRMYICYSFMD